MIKLPTQVAGMITGLWALGIGAASSLPGGLPWWAHYAIAAGGVLLAGLFGVNVTTTPTSTSSSPTSTRGGDWT